MAEELVRIYALQAGAPGPRLQGRTPGGSSELEASFIYEDTADQARATAEIKRDMERPKPMDRLVCGDVGLRQDRGGDPGGLQGGDGRQAGGGAGADDRAGAAALTTPSASGWRITRSRSRCSRGSGPPRSRAAIVEGLGRGDGGHRDRHPPADAEGRRLQGPGAGDHRRGAALRRGPQGDLQADAGDRGRADPDRHADPAHAPHGADGRARHVHHRHAAEGQAAGRDRGGASSTRTWW